MKTWLYMIRQSFTEWPYIRLLVYLLTLALPWSIRRRVLSAALGYSIHPSSRIGFALVVPKHLVMEANSRICTLTVCKGLDRIHLKEHAIIGRGNWITGIPASSGRFYSHQKDRRSELLLGEHSCITNRHIIDCTNSVEIGAFSSFGGFRSQILTHSADLTTCRQSSAAVRIGEYCLIGTGCVVLSGSSLPDHSVLGAASLLNKQYSEAFWLYAGVPARPVKALSKDLGYFKRNMGFID